jgi:Fur family ferric uptake transcriptional regulator
MGSVMTPITPAVDELLRGLAERGHRITPQRRAILDALSRAGGHVTAEELWFQVRDRARGVNVSTVYRTLQALEALGAVTHAEEPDGCSRYHLVEHAHHLHLHCRRCGAEREVDATLAEPLLRSLADRYGFSVDTAHLALRGLCRDCAPLG